MYVILNVLVCICLYGWLYAYVSLVGGAVSGAHEAISSGSNLSVPIGVPDCSWTLTDPEPHIHAYIHTCMYIRTYVHTCIGAYLHIRAYVYEHMYIFTYLRTYARTHTNEFNSGV